MADVVDKATRSRMMAGIQGRNTKPELRLRRLLHSAGFRYRLHIARLPGKPDLVLPKWNSVILVQGCFWHQHCGCRWATTPVSNGKFWKEKLVKNVERDERNIAELLELGWRVGTVWECALKKLPDDKVIRRVSSWLAGKSRRFDLRF